MEGNAEDGRYEPGAAAARPTSGPPAVPAAPPPPPPPPQAPQQPQEQQVLQDQEQQLLQGQRLVRRVEQAAVLRALLYQVRLYFYSGGQFSMEWHLRFAVLAVLRICLLVGSLNMRATTWMQHRTAIIFAGRVCTCALMQSSTGVSAIALSHTATPGAAGMLRDWLRAVIGTRLSEIAISGVLFHLPPFAVAAQGALLLGLVVGRGNPGFCATPLLSHPLTQQRMARLWEWLQMLPLTLVPVPVGTLSSTLLEKLPAPAAHQARCVSILVWHECLLGVVLPSLVAAWTHPVLPIMQQQQQIPPLRQATAAIEQQQPGLPAVLKRCVQRTAAAGYRAWAAMESAVGECCRLIYSDGFHLLLVALQLPGFLWLLSKAAAARVLSLPVL